MAKSMAKTYGKKYVKNVYYKYLNIYSIKNECKKGTKVPLKPLLLIYKKGFAQKGNLGSP